MRFSDFGDIFKIFNYTISQKHLLDLELEKVLREGKEDYGAEFDYSVELEMLLAKHEEFPEKMQACARLWHYVRDLGKLPKT